MHCQWDQGDLLCLDSRKHWLYRKKTWWGCIIPLKIILFLKFSCGAQKKFVLWGLLEIDSLLSTFIAPTAGHAALRFHIYCEKCNQVQSCKCWTFSISLDTILPISVAICTPMHSIRPGNNWYMCLKVMERWFCSLRVLHDLSLFFGWLELCLGQSSD